MAAGVVVAGVVAGVVTKGAVRAVTKGAVRAVTKGAVRAARQAREAGAKAVCTCATERRGQRWTIVR